MVKTLQSAMKTPIIGKIRQLDKYIWEHQTKPPKLIQRQVVEPMIKNIGELYTYAIKELRGNVTMTNWKRFEELIIEIQSAAYRIYDLKGWNLKTSSVIDAFCDEIYKDLNKYHFANFKTNPIKSKDEDSKA